MGLLDDAMRASGEGDILTDSLFRAGLTCPIFSVLGLANPRVRAATCEDIPQKMGQDLTT